MKTADAQVKPATSVKSEPHQRMVSVQRRQQKEISTAWRRVAYLAEKLELLSLQRRELITDICIEVANAKSLESKYAR